MHIDNVHINIGRESPMVKALLESLFTKTSADDSAPAVTGPTAIGDAWPGQGGIYCGVARGEDGQRDHHLILADARPDQKFNWQEAQDFAKTVVADGHTDFALPTRSESALLYANVRDNMDASEWHWNSTQASEDGAWDQYFGHGSQGTSSKESQALARFVRRLNL